MIATVGWFYGLPNHTYLYVFSWVPIAVYFIWYFGFDHITEMKAQIVASLLLFSAAIYVASGAAQMYRGWIIPVGMFPILIGVWFAWRGYQLILAYPVAVGRPLQVAAMIAGPMVMIMVSTIYVQPWSLVWELPNVKGGSFRDTDFSGLSFNRVKFSGTDLTGANFTGSNLIGIEFNDVNLGGAEFGHANIRSVIFFQSRLQGSSFGDATIYQTKFKRSDLSDANFEVRFVGRSYIENSFVCGSNFQNLQELASFKSGFYGWSGSFYDVRTKFPKQIDPKLEEMKLVEKCNWPVD